MQLVCDYCGNTFERPHYVINKNRGLKLKHHYCDRDCAAAATHKMSPIPWLSAATEDDERYFVNRIIHCALEMQKVEQFSPEWDKLDAVHSALLDAIKFIFKLRGKYQSPTTGEDEDE